MAEKVGAVAGQNERRKRPAQILINSVLIFLLIITKNEQPIDKRLLFISDYFEGVTLIKGVAPLVTCGNFPSHLSIAFS